MFQGTTSINFPRVESQMLFCAPVLPLTCPATVRMIVREGVSTGDKRYPGRQLSAGKMKDAPSFLKGLLGEAARRHVVLRGGNCGTSRSRQLIGRWARWPQPSPSDGTCPGPLSCQIYWSPGFKIFLYYFCLFARYLMIHHIVILEIAICVSSPFL